MAFNTYLSRFRGWTKSAPKAAKPRKPKSHLALEALEDRLALSTVNFSGSAPNRVLTYQAAAGEVNSLEVSRTGNTFTFAETGGVVIQLGSSLNSSVTVDGSLFNRIEVKLGDQADSVTVLSTSKRIDVFGEAGSDVVNLGATGAGIDGIQAPVNVNGGADAGSTDELFLNDQDAAVVVTPVRINGIMTPLPTTLSYTVAGASVSRQRLNALGAPFGAAFTVTPTNMERLELNASNQSDMILVKSTLAKTTVRVRGGDGADTITVANLRDINSELTVRGNDGVDKLVIDDRSATAGRNYIVNAESLSAGSNKVLWSGIQEASVLAPNRNNTFDVQSLSSDTALTLAGGTQTDTVTISDAGLTQGQTYAFTAGKVERSGAVLKHSGVNTLVVKAGIGGDVFQMTNSGQPTVLRLDGGQGRDRIDYSAYTTNVVVNLKLGNATRVTVLAGVEDATGGSGHDILVGDDGANEIKGLAGKDVLIGGKGADTILGGAGEDLMIASSTAYDADAGRLGTIRLVWAGATAGTFTNRINTLKAGTGTGNFFVRLDETNVHVGQANDDGAIDVLSSFDDAPPPAGNTPDWFWSNPDVDIRLMFVGNSDQLK